MSRKSRSQKARDLSRAQEVLHSPINSSGEGEDPAVKALIQRLAFADHVEAVEIALALQKLIRGSNSLLEDPEAADVVNRIRAEAAERDDAARRYAQDGQKFIDETWDRAERLLPASGPARDQLAAKAAKITEDAMQRGAIVAAHNKKRMDWELDHGPQEMLTVQGEVLMVREGDSIRSVVAPIIIGIRHRVYKLYPGTYSVPKVVADSYRARVRGTAESAEREQAMTPREGLDGRDDQMVGRLDAINRKYGSPGESIPFIGVR